VSLNFDQEGQGAQPVPQKVDSKLVSPQRAYATGDRIIAIGEALPACGQGRTQFTEPVQQAEEDSLETNRLLTPINTLYRQLAQAH
jgi:hypothetical protein